MEELLKKINEINGKLIEIKDKVDRSTFNISGGEGHVNNVNDGGIGIVNQTNNFFIENKFMAQKINKQEQPLKIRKLPNLHPIFVIIHNLFSILLILFFSLTIISGNVQNPKVLSIIIGFLFVYLLIYYLKNFIIIVNESFIKINNRIFNFEDIRKMKFCRNLIGSYIGIYLKDSLYPDIKIYINNENQMDLIQEFYYDYLVSIEKKRTIKKLTRKSLLRKYKSFK